MRIHGKFHALGINEDKLHFVRSCAEEQAEQHSIEADALPLAGGACHKQVRHFGNVGGNRMTAGILAQRHREQRFRVPEGFIFHDVAEIHHLAVFVGNLHPDCVRSRHGRQHAYRLRLERHGEIVGKVGDARGLHPGSWAQLKHRHDWSWSDLCQFGIDMEIPEAGDDGLALAHQLFPVRSLSDHNQSGLVVSTYKP